MTDRRAESVAPPLSEGVRDQVEQKYRDIARVAKIQAGIVQLNAAKAALESSLADSRQRGVDIFEAPEGFVHAISVTRARKVVVGKYSAGGGCFGASGPAVENPRSEMAEPGVPFLAETIEVYGDKLIARSLGGHSARELQVFDEVTLVPRDDPHGHPVAWGTTQIYSELHDDTRF